MREEVRGEGKVAEEGFLRNKYLDKQMNECPQTDSCGLIIGNREAIQAKIRSVCKTSSMPIMTETNARSTLETKSY